MEYNQMTIEELITEKDRLSNEISRLYKEIEWNNNLMKDKDIHYTDKRELENENVANSLRINKLHNMIGEINDSLSNRVVKKLNN